jgi:hypothetical protein
MPSRRAKPFSAATIASSILLADASGAAPIEGERSLSRSITGTIAVARHSGIEACLSRGVEYDDGRHQSVQVCVDWKLSYLAMSIMRFRDNASRISFFYSRLPQRIVKQTGVWEARATEAGCCLRLIRSLRCSAAERKAMRRFMSGRTPLAYC